MKLDGSLERTFLVRAASRAVSPGSDTGNENDTDPAGRWFSTNSCSNPLRNGCTRMSTPACTLRYNAD